MRGSVSHEMPRIRIFPLTCTLDTRTQWRASVIRDTSRGLLLAGLVSNTPEILDFPKAFFTSFFSY